MPAATPDLSKTKLTADVWKQMQDEEKYSVDMLKRLRSEDPAFRAPEAWKKFHKEVITPGFQREVLKKNPAAPPPQAD